MSTPTEITIDAYTTPHNACRPLTLSGRLRDAVTLLGIPGKGITVRYNGFLLGTPTTIAGGVYTISDVYFLPPS
ncbi:unnamed protein product, partial [marine sediment metagenome]